ncbi:hypothetical protein LG634_19860 [Streptomyces bambusae]|uniref:hypothetical protein n=1 Tax=Streptomyces bambusae TaxID=1550616 RepID=UPI001CFCC070|nr:hypothetical protein [Streptomyces bambusae]MCB5167084.1 hypothetical protein [Streptomyces bambusae]
MSQTPIFDELYAEYMHAFRALPGDRSGEENLGFTAFGPSYGSRLGSTYPSTAGGTYGGSYGSTVGSSYAGSGWSGPGPDTGTYTGTGTWPTGSWQPTGSWGGPDPWPDPPGGGGPSYAALPARVTPVPPAGYGATAGAYASGRPHHTGTHVPAALPPAPRRAF